MDDGTRLTRWHVVFAGRVQHVGFRYTAFYLARSLCLTGWVDNLPDGRVEMEVQGPVALLLKMLLLVAMNLQAMLSSIQWLK